MIPARHILKMRRCFAIGDKPVNSINERKIFAGDQTTNNSSYFELGFIEIPIAFLDLNPKDQSTIYPRMFEMDPLVLKLLGQADALELIGRMVGKRKVATQLVFVHRAKWSGSYAPCLDSVLAGYARRFRHRNALHFAGVAGEIASKFLKIGFVELPGSGFLMAGRPGRFRGEKLKLSARVLSKSKSRR